MFFIHSIISYLLISLSLFFTGIFFILPCIDAYARVDLRTRTYDVPPQELSINTKFNIPFLTFIMKILQHYTHKCRTIEIT